MVIRKHLPFADMTRSVSSVWLEISQIKKIDAIESLAATVEISQFG
jgi:hypothetical protein